MADSQKEPFGPSGSPAGKPGLARGRRWPAFLTLVLLSPVITEYLSGSTRLSNPEALMVETAIWGCGALLCREIVRRRGLGWPSLVGLGLAFSVVVEFLIVQTSVAPLIGTGPAHPYGRWLGVNWTWLTWALGYESIWAVLVPVALTEMIFPARRNEPWLRRPGLVVCATVFVLGSYGGWYIWTQIVIAKLFPAYAYTPPAGTLLIALAVAAIVAAASLAVTARPASAAGRAPHPVAAGVAATVLALLWYGLLMATYSPPRRVSPALLVAGGVVLAAVAVLLLRRWSARSGWADAHRLALCTGALIVSMLLGFMALQGASRSDVVGKLVLNVIALLLLAWLGWTVRRRRQASDAAFTPNSRKVRPSS